MFWKYNNASSSKIEAVLAKEDVSLQELMEEEDIINECKLQNSLLMDFLTKPEIIEELVTLTTVEPSAELDERVRFKYSNIACEILTCDVPTLNEKLASDEKLLSKLYVFLDGEPPLNPLLASFFSKIMGALITKKIEQVLDFLKAKENFISILLKHLGTSAIMDLTLKLMTQVEGPEVRPNILNWLDSQRIIQMLVSLLDPAVDKERHDNVAQLLCDFIKISRDNQRNSTERNDPDPLLNNLESPETVSLLLDHMLASEKCESCIVGGIQVLLGILDINKVSGDESNDVERRQAVVDSTILTVLKRLGDFHKLLLDPPKKASIDTTIGILDPPLGNTRLQVSRLFAAIISTNNPELMKEIISLGTMEVLLDLFYAFPWNNFLHTQVQACIISALKGAHIPSETGDDNALYKHLIVNCKLVEKILAAWNDNDVQQLEQKGTRQGYMGHLANIACSIADMCSTSPLGQFLKDNLPDIHELFDKFIESTLRDVQRTRDILLGGVHPNTSNEDSDEYGDSPLAQSSLPHQQMFAQYQVHQLTPQIIEIYGFNDDYFNDADDTLQTIDHRTGMNFDLSEGDLIQQHELFKQVCAQNINTLDDADDQIFEDRDHTFQTVIQKHVEDRDAVYSSDSDEEDSPPPDDPFADVDPFFSMTENQDSESAIAPVSPVDPWILTGQAALGVATGWANFSSPSFANFEANFETPSNTEASTTTSSAKTNSNMKVVKNKEDFNILQLDNEMLDLFDKIKKCVAEQFVAKKETDNTSVNVPKEDEQPVDGQTNVEEGACKVETDASVKSNVVESNQEDI